LDLGLTTTAQVASAGIRPQDKADTRNAVHTLQAFGIDASAHKPQDVRSVDPAKFDFVVSIDDPGSDRIAKAVQALGIPSRQHVRWKINDPTRP
jgi:protein-tyrosine-phosphatase